jgi:hypothetical protein
MKHFVNRDPDTVLVIGKGFKTHGDIFSVGPVLAVEDAHFMGDVTGADLVWFVDESFPRGVTTGLPVILAPSAKHSQMNAGSPDIWWGDYGWRRPTDFLKPAPVTLTRKELDTLWEELSGAESPRLTRALRTLVAGQEQTVPFFQERLRLPAAPDEKRLAQLVADLDSDDFKTREAASAELGKHGLSVVSALRQVLKKEPSAEARRRIEEVLSTTEAEQRRLRRALQALEQADSPAARRLLADLARGENDSFLAEEARAGLKRLEGKSKP